MHVACRRGLEEVVRELISSGADVEAKDLVCAEIRRIVYADAKGCGGETSQGANDAFVKQFIEYDM